MATPKPVWGPSPEVISNAKLNQMTAYAEEQLAAQAAASALNQITVASNYTVVGDEDRLDLDNASGAVVTLPAPVEAMWKQSRVTIENIGDAGTWTVEISGPTTFSGGADSVSLAPGSSLETYVAKRANGSYRWAKI
jgi:hypothetical protein